MKILCLGNPLVKEDATALTLAKEIVLPGVEFIPCLTSDDFLRYAEDNTKLKILDVAEGISDVTLLKGADKLGIKDKFSSHDFDIGFFIKLLEGLGKLPEIEIIAIPKTIPVDEAKDKVEEIIRKMDDS